jgi:hypothetical protein
VINCIRCGREIGQGELCLSCRGGEERLKALLATAEADAELLRRALSATNAAIARELGISRAAVGQRIARARERTAQRMQLAADLLGIEEQRSE